MRTLRLAVVILLAAVAFAATGRAASRSAVGHASVVVLNPTRIEPQFMTRNGRVKLGFRLSGPDDGGYIVQVRSGAEPAAEQWRRPEAGPLREIDLPSPAKGEPVYVTHIRY